jgi:hypothetical protein
MAAYLCGAGWLDVYGMMVSVCVGFRNMDMFTWLQFLIIVMSK